MHTVCPRSLILGRGSSMPIMRGISSRFIRSDCARSFCLVLYAHCTDSFLQFSFFSCSLVCLDLGLAFNVCCFGLSKDVFELSRVADHFIGAIDDGDVLGDFGGHGCAV